MAKEEKKFIVKETKAGKDEYAIKKAPSKTLWGKILVVLIVIGTLLVPVAAMIIAMVSK